MDLSIIIPCYEHSDELQECLSHLQLHALPASCEVIVIDSASDSRVADIAGRFERTALLRSQTRLFPGEARNLGVQRSRGACLAFLDSDCIPAEGWVGVAMACARGPNLLSGGPVLDVWPAHPVAWVDNQLQFADFRSGRSAGPGYHFPACNMVVRREVFAQLGGFAEGVPTGEDVVFCEQAARLFPERMWFEPQLIVRHHGRRRLRAMLDHQRLLGTYRSRLRLAMTPAWKWLSRSYWLGGLAMLRRLGYIIWRTWEYDARELFRLILFMPLLLLGLIAWTRGFYHGLQSESGASCR